MTIMCKPKNLEEWVMIKRIGEKLGHVVRWKYDDINRAYEAYPNLIYRKHTRNLVGRLNGRSFIYSGDDEPITVQEFLKKMGYVKQIPPFKHIKKHTV